MGERAGKKKKRKKGELDFDLAQRGKKKEGASESALFANSWVPPPKKGKGGGMPRPEGDEKGGHFVSAGEDRSFGFRNRARKERSGTPQGGENLFHQFRSYHG